MKNYFKFVLLFIFLNAFIIDGFAQSFAQKSLVGGKIGINRTNFMQERGESLVAIPRLSAGVFYYYQLNKWLQLSTEIDYSEQGAKTHRSEFFLFSLFSNDVRPTKVFYTTENIRSSFAIHASNIVNNRLSPTITLGIYNSILTDSFTEISEGDDYALGDTINTIDEEGYISMDFGVLFGMGIKYRTKRGKQLLFDYRHHFGMVDIAKSSNYVVRNSVVSFNFSLLIPLKRFLFI